MTTLTITSRGQVTFKKEVPKHVGLQPEDKTRLALLPQGRAELSAERHRVSWSQISGCLKGKTNGAVLTIDEINEAIAEAGAAVGVSGL